MKKCKNCVDFPVCDFCRYYRFNPDKRGCYIDRGYCKKHKKKKEPEEEACDDFHCSLRLTLFDRIKNNIWYYFSINLDF